ncbi:MAG: ethanolamine utilization protein EutH [Clostridiales bacterium]|nr:ethanolamine utilization protein EutH [Clostridiales bacterium]
MIWSIIADIITWIIMICAAIGLIGYIKNPDEGVGREFATAFSYMGIVFIPFAGMLAALPYLEEAILFLFGGLFELIGADVAIAGAIVTGPDMGGWQLTERLSANPETWMIGIFLCYLAGPILSYTMPIGFSMLDKRDYKYFGLGTMAGVLSIPFGVFIMVLICKIGRIMIRPGISTDAESTYALDFHWDQIFINMIPIIVFCVVLAILMKVIMDIMVKIFMVLGRIVEIGVRVVVVLCIIEYFTGFFSGLFGSHWKFAPMLADEVDQSRGIEQTGYVIFMMAGAFPMVYLIKKYVGKIAGEIGEKIGFSSNGVVGIISSWADIIIAFGFFNRIRPVDKVKLTAYGVCGSWIVASHLSITVTFQPNLVAVVLLGKILAGIIGVVISLWISVPVARRFEEKDRELGIIGEHEYINDDMSAEEIEELTKN